MTAKTVYGVNLGDRFHHPEQDEDVTVIEFITPQGPHQEWVAILSNEEKLLVKTLKEWPRE